ncbi:MAG: S-layer homology domain-containing protein [Firmicutes bacterium]|nr:S-layer homology domain-containing protein [Bacillota bacterium]
MNKIISVTICICIAVMGVSGISICADEANLLSDAVIWTPETNIYSADNLSNLVDGDAATGLESKNLGTAAVWRLFFDIKPDGSMAPTYNKLKINFNSYNAMKISVYTSSQVYNRLGGQTDPPTSNAASAVRFQSYTNPVYTANFEPYYVSKNGDEGYPGTHILPFETKNDRFICIEITNAYDSVSGEYLGVNNIISGVELSNSAPSEVIVSSDTDSVAIPSALAQDKKVSFTAMVLDSDGDELSDAVLSDVAFSLDRQYSGVSIDPNSGVLTITKSAKVSDITVIAACTAGEYTDIFGAKTISLTAVDPVEQQISEALTALNFSHISPQRINSVGSNLSPLKAVNGLLSIGDKEYYDMDISWRSSNTSVITNEGIVTRPANANANVTFTATLSKVKSNGEIFSAEKEFNITVIKSGELVDMVNIMKGGYGWVTSGWGNASNAVDGNLSTYWALGNHTHTTITAGFKTASGEIEKYNKAVITLWNIPRMTAYEITGYENVPDDPGVGGSSPFKGAAGGTVIVSYNPNNVLTHPDANGKVVVKMTESAQSRYFGIAITNGTNTSDNSCGVYEFELYYATPNDAELLDKNFVLYKPLHSGEASFDIPKFKIYDEAGDVLDAKFDYSVSLAQNYKGITIKDEKITVSSDCTANSVDLIYKSWDDERVWLEKSIAVPLESYTQEYYDTVETGAYLKSIIPQKVEADLNLMTEHNGSTIKWTSNNKDYISETGAVNRPANAQKDEKVFLTAEISKGGFTIIETFDVIVIKNMTDLQRVIQDANRIELGISGTVSSDINLPQTGYYGSDITWSSGNTNIISNDGKYRKSSASKAKTPVVLTAEITYNGETTTKDFTIYAETTVSGGGGSGGSSGAGSAFYPGATTVPPMVELTDDEIVKGRFEDVPAGHWAKEYIETLAEKKILNGTSQTEFEPDRPVAREEFIKMIIVAFGYTLKPGETEFIDIEKDAWYEDYVITAYKENITAGMGNSMFGIGQNITREDMAVLMERVLVRHNVDFIGASKSFLDIKDISEYAISSVENLASIDIISGDDTGRFLPKNNATRAEAAKMLLAAMEKGGIMQ